MPSRSRNYRRDYHFLVNYGITLIDVEQMRKSQSGRCAICDVALPKILEYKTVKHGLAVDHCHNSGRVRGLLCRSCNLLLGYAKDSTEILGNAISYLLRHTRLIDEEDQDAEKNRQSDG